MEDKEDVATKMEVDSKEEKKSEVVDEAEEEEKSVEKLEQKSDEIEEPPKKEESSEKSETELKKEDTPTEEQVNVPECHRFEGSAEIVVFNCGISFFSKVCSASFFLISQIVFKSNIV